MSQFLERTFEIKGRRMAAKCWHDPAKPKLLTLHGWLDNASSFDRMAPLLDAFHIVALDFAGHGFSDHRPEGMRYHTLDYVDDVHAVLQQLGWDRFVLMGHSMGAGVSCLFAGTFPERIEKLVLLEGLGPLSGQPAEAPQILRKAVEELAAQQNGTRVFDDFELAVKARQAGLSGPMSEQAARILCERGVKAVEGGYTWTTDKRARLRSVSRLTEEQVLAFMRGITAPTLLVRAESGLPYEKAMYEGRLQALAQLRVEQLPGGHHLHLDESPEAAAALVLSFLKHD